jgi:exodeoxyribonuclease V alpha subunit
VRAFGEAVFDVIEQEPPRLREVTGIGPKRAARIIAGWAEQKIIREIMLFLHTNGVGTSRAVRIYKTYGVDAVQLISENPYRLARDICGIGFRTADQIAARLGIDKTALIRVRAGISYALAEAMDEGHCGLPTEELTALTGKLLDVSADLIEMALRLELQAGAVVADVLDGRRCVFLAGLYRAEREIAEKLKALSVGSPPCIVNAHRINQGLMPDLAPVESGDFYFVDAADPEDGVRKLLAIVQERIPKRFGPA